MRLDGIFGKVAKHGVLNVKISNALNTGKVTGGATSTGEILGTCNASNSCPIENCFYSSKSTNKGVGQGIVTGSVTSGEINTTLISTLNQYVENYNSTNRLNKDFIELSSWELHNNGVKFK